jgi:hypothetical protein
VAGYLCQHALSFNSHPSLQDQIHHLREAGIRAASFTASADWSETRALMGDIMATGSDVRILFVTPEKVGRAGTPAEGGQQKAVVCCNHHALLTADR